VRALAPGTGWSGEARVQARASGGGWRECPYSRVGGTYECPGLGRVAGATANVLWDYPASNAYLTPSITAWPVVPETEFRVEMMRRLAGRYWTGATQREGATLEIAGQPPLGLDRRRQLVVLEPVAEPRAVVVTLATSGSKPLAAVLVREDGLDIDRHTDAPAPPDAAPPGIAP
jgi:hypothetical protein